MREFGAAAAAGFDAIEWIYDTWGEEVNPLSSDSGIRQIKNLARQNGVAVLSLCADYFMEQPLIRVSPEERRNRIQHLRWLISRCQLLGIGRIVLPFVDNSSIRTESEITEVAATLLELLPHSSEAGVEIHLETSLNASSFAVLLDKLPFPDIKVNYDTGNSASLGFDFREEFSAYGSRIGSVHVKDRIRGGGTVPLGQGNANLPGVLAGLRELGYYGDFILQVTRGEAGREVEWARHNRLALMSHWHLAEMSGGVPQ